MKNREISVINIQYEISMLADMEICECILHILRYIKRERKGEEKQLETSASGLPSIFDVG